MSSQYFGGLSRILCGLFSLLSRHGTPSHSRFRNQIVFMRVQRFPSRKINFPGRLPFLSSGYRRKIKNKNNGKRKEVLGSVVRKAYNLSHWAFRISIASDNWSQGSLFEKKTITSLSDKNDPTFQSIMKYNPIFFFCFFLISHISRMSQIMTSFRRFSSRFFPTGFEIRHEFMGLL